MRAIGLCMLESAECAAVQIEVSFSRLAFWL